MEHSNWYLKPNIAIEPLYNRWYAHGHLIAPATAPLFVNNLHLKLMEAFVSAPEMHVAALKNRALRGGPFINHPATRAAEVRALLSQTRQEQSASIALAQAIASLENLLNGSADGHSLEQLYPAVPDLLRGYVELTYGLDNHPSARFIEALMYRGPHYRESSQSVLLWELHGDERHHIFSTPRLEESGHLSLSVPFRHEGLDALFQARTRPVSRSAVREQLAVAEPGWALFDSFFTESAPPPPPSPPEPDELRIRYFGHACVLIETADVKVITDPVVSYAFPTHLPRFTYQDLPEKIDYVLLTHAHADHLMWETLLQLRHRVGTFVVPRGSGTLADPSLKLMLRHTGFPRVQELDELDELPIPGGSLIGLPFLGEHGDLDIRAKIAHLVRLNGKSVLMAADSNAIEPRLYELVESVVGELDLLFLGMECEGAPVTWNYGPLLTASLSRRMDQSRRLNGSNCARAAAIVDCLAPKQVYVYALGREPWLGHVMVLDGSETAPQILESNRLIQHCRQKGIDAERLFIQKELHLR